MFDIDTIKSLARCKFTMDFPGVTLTQLVATKPQVRRGSGVISQDENGRLMLNVSLNHELDAGDVLMNAVHAPAGTLMDDSAFFQMEATDKEGYVWKCDRLIVEDNPGHEAQHPKVTARIRGMESTKTWNREDIEPSCDLVIVGVLPIPFNESVKDGNKTSLSIFSGALHTGITYQIRQFEDYAIIQLACADPQHAVGSKLVESISIATGLNLEVVHRSKISNQLKTCQINSFHREYIDEKLWTVLGEKDYASMAEFVKCYVRLFDGQTGYSYFTFWLTIWSAWFFGMAPAALPLGVYVEGVIKEFFPDLMKESDETIGAFNAIIKHLSDSVDTLKAAKVPEQLISRACNAISMMKSKSATTALKALVAAGYFDDKLLMGWRTIRHKSAHGADLISLQEYAALEEVSDGILGCLHLFYVLLFIKIEFRGYFLDLSKHGFPRTRLTPLVNQSTTTKEEATEVTPKGA